MQAETWVWSQACFENNHVPAETTKASVTSPYRPNLSCVEFTVICASAIIASPLFICNLWHRHGANLILRLLVQHKDVQRWN